MQGVHNSYMFSSSSSSGGGGGNISSSNISSSNVSSSSSIRISILISSSETPTFLPPSYQPRF